MGEEKAQAEWIHLVFKRPPLPSSPTIPPQGNAVDTDSHRDEDLSKLSFLVLYHRGVVTQVHTHTQALCVCVCAHTHRLRSTAGDCNYTVTTQSRSMWPGKLGQKQLWYTRIKWNPDSCISWSVGKLLKKIGLSCYLSASVYECVCDSERVPTPGKTCLCVRALIKTDSVGEFHRSETVGQCHRGVQLFLRRKTTCSHIRHLAPLSLLINSSSAPSEETLHSQHIN